MRKDTKYKTNFLIGFNRHKITLKMATKVETLSISALVLSRLVTMWGPPFEQLHEPVAISQSEEALTPVSRNESEAPLQGLLCCGPRPAGNTHVLPGSRERCV